MKNNSCFINHLLSFKLTNYYFFFLIFYTPLCAAQSAYNQWVATQDEEVHLKGTCKIKTIFESATGDLANLKLTQQQYFVKGRMVRDVMYVNYPIELMYDIRISYASDGTAQGLNVLDSSLVTYSFTEDQKILYYVVEEQSDLHIIYTYDEQGRLIRCKDCLFPFDNHQWCAYYNYYYNNDNKILKAESHSLEKGKELDTKTLIAYDSLVYKDGLLQKRLSLSPTEVVTNEVVYEYNKQKLLERETAQQTTSLFLEAQSYTKEYSYRCNKKMKLQKEEYFTNGKLLGKQLVYYDSKGRKIKQESYRADGTKSKLYLIKYN